MKAELVEFKDRSSRSEFIARRFQTVLNGKILDVGCDKAVLKKLLPQAEYTGVDIGGEPDIQVNLEEAGRLPFPDDSFDCVVCTDVLEHMENLHQIFGEPVRVSRRHLVIFPPNNWNKARVPISRGRGSFGKYGLPAEKPAIDTNGFLTFRKRRTSSRHRLKNSRWPAGKCLPSRNPALLSCVVRADCGIPSWNTI